MNRRTFLAASAGLLAAPAIAAQKKETVRIVSSLPRRGGAVKEITDGITDSIRLAIADREKEFPFEVKYHDLDDTAGEPTSFPSAPGSHPGPRPWSSGWSARSSSTRRTP